MNLVLRILFIVVSVIVFVRVIFMLIRRRLNESNSILWLFIAFVILVFGFFPKLINSIAQIVGIDYAPALLFLVSILILMLIAFKGSLEVSQIDAKVNELAMELAILKEEYNLLVSRLAEEEKNEREDEAL